MKILQLTNKPPWPARDGGAIAILNLTKGFYRLGHQVTVLAMNTGKHHINPVEIPDDIHKTASFRFIDVPAETSYQEAFLNLLFSSEPYTAVRFVSDSFHLELIQILKETSFDIVQLEGSYLCPYIPVIREFSKAIIALRAHNIESEIWERTAAASKGIKKWYLKNLASRIRKFEGKWMNRYDVLVPITERDEDQLNRMGNSRPSVVIQASIDFACYQPSLSKTEFPSLFHIGSLDWMPNQEGLLWFLDNCWDNIRAKYPSLSFYVAGRNAPEWLITRLKRPGMVFMGEVEDAATFIQSKGIMVVPLFSGSGMRVKIVEGMAYGKAIISTSIGAEGLQVADNVNIMIADQPHEYIRKIELLLENEPFSIQLGKKAETFAQENFDHVILAGKLLDFYQHQIE
jgi:glycosyltransferase involved in cell wall biosynthesis